jgi:propionate CoA-transferase
LEEKIEGGKLKIVKEGDTKKFVTKVDHVTFSGEYGKTLGKRVLYVTERCVFGLSERGIILKEIAPGVNLDRDILGQMDFAPLVADDLATMDSRIFSYASMGLKNSLTKLEEDHPRETLTRPSVPST